MTLPSKKCKLSAISILAVEKKKKKKKKKKRKEKEKRKQNRKPNGKECCAKKKKKKKNNNNNKIKKNKSVDFEETARTRCIIWNLTVCKTFFSGLWS